MIDNGRVRGLWCANLTPLDRNGRLDGARMAAHIRILLGQGVDGVAPFGTTGEGPSFSVAERRAGLDGLLAALRTRDPQRAVAAIEAHLTSARNRALGL